jgi:hypothetical protein
MELLPVIVFFILVLVLFNYGKLTTTRPQHPLEDKSGHVKPAHLLYDMLSQFSSGDKLYLSGKCQINIYTKYIINVDMKQKFIKLINHIFQSMYNISQRIYQVQELNNIYEQIDTFNNKRYIIDATLNSVSNYYTVRVLLDIVIINNEIFINYLNINDASNNNIIDKYDIVYQDQGILLNHNNFTSNIRALLDEEYKKQNKLIAINSAMLDSKNYDLTNVVSLNSMLKRYLPSTLSRESEKNLTMKGLSGQLEQYFPSDQPSIKSPQFCNKYLNGWKTDSVGPPGNESCVFDHNNTETEYNQPYMGPGLFFNRSSL